MFILRTVVNKEGTKLDSHTLSILSYMLRKAVIKYVITAVLSRP